MTKGKAKPRKSQEERDARDERGTPLWLYKDLDRVFNFVLDVCASEENHKHENYFTKAENSLIQEWGIINFMNPPYSDMSPWIDKAYEESQKGRVTVGLLKSDHSTKWFDALERTSQIWLCSRRIKYEGAESAADFPSLIAIWDENRITGIKSRIPLDKYNSNWSERLRL